MNVQAIDRRLLYIAAGVLAIPVVSTIFSRLYRPVPKQGQIILSPLETQIPQLSFKERRTLPYPSDSYLPGARDVDTPYGNIRVYEFGPSTTDRRIVFLHGISTPCISLADIAHRLAREGCRVMLIDLFGRGYSSGPSDLNYDNRLYATQVLMAVTSSPVSWIGDGRRFTLVGYSLGGGLSMDFTSWFPHLVDDVVLIAPGGLQRLGNISLRSKILYSTGLLPERVLRWLVKRRLTSDYPPLPKSDAAGNDDLQDSEALTAAEKVITAEVPDSTEAAPIASDSNAPPWAVDVDGTIAWQLEKHDGFVPAFMSSFKHCPIYNQQTRWQIVAQRLNDQRASPESPHSPSSLRSKAVLLVLGEKDEIVTVDETTSDARDVLGERNLETVVIKGAGHDVPISSATEVAEHILSFWLANAADVSPSTVTNLPVSIEPESQTTTTATEAVAEVETIEDGSKPAETPPETNARTESTKVKDLKQKLKEEREARKLEVGDVQREQEVRQMEMDEVKGENARLKAMLALKRDEILKHLDATMIAQERQRRDEGGDEMPPESSCPTL